MNQGIIEIKKFKIRCSGISQIMTNPRSKKDQEAGILAKTAQTFCKTWLKEQLYMRRNEFSSKYTDKGNIMEDNSIDFIGAQLDLGLLLKNEEELSNDFMTGTPDVRIPALIIDAKNSWDCFTFPLFEEDVPNDAYYWQAQGYLELENKDDYKLVYVLSDTPIHLIEKEAYWYCKNNGYDELDNDIYHEFEDRMTYPRIDDSLKIKVFDIKRSPEDVMKIQERVIQCRVYINSLIAMLPKNINVIINNDL